MFYIGAVVKDKKNGCTFKCITVYGASSDENRQEFIDELQSIMLEISEPVIIGGDFNLVKS